MGSLIKLFGNLADKFGEFILYVALIVILVNMGGAAKLVAFIVIGIFILGGILRGIGTWLEHKGK
jgi:hypothetical protein